MLICYSVFKKDTLSLKIDTLSYKVNLYEEGNNN